MAKPTSLLVSILLLLFFADISKAQEVDVNQAHRDSLNSIINQYYSLNVKVFQSNSTIEDIDNIFGLYTDDFTYIHPKYGGTYSRQDLYEGYVRNQKNGGYDGSVTDIKVINRIVGLNAVVVEKKFIKKVNNQIVEGDSQMTLFEFKGGKISKIFEYW
ncbi:MAG: nuclear transport factor 2 family protein [Bacteroidota bacterium]